MKAQVQTSEAQISRGIPAKLRGTLSAPSREVLGNQVTFGNLETSAARRIAYRHRKKSKVIHG